MRSLKELIYSCIETHFVSTQLECKGSAFTFREFNVLLNISTQSSIKDRRQIFLQKRIVFGYFILLNEGFFATEYSSIDKGSQTIKVS